jgi:SAM-dependent methyltransferase
MASEASKTKKIWTDAERALLQGKGIDIGCGLDPIFPSVRRFDREDGDANVISRHVSEQFDFVFSSHCLEHMHEPRSALREWWKLVRPGGVLIFLVPDEDLYEQGVFPSRFNDDHKATFTISKRQSWSPVSHNIVDLAASLADAEIVSVQLHDMNYDRRLLVFGAPPAPGPVKSRLAWLYFGLRRRLRLSFPALEAWFAGPQAVDQTRRPDTFAQIQAILRKKPPVSP